MRQPPYWILSLGKETSVKFLSNVLYRPCFLQLIIHPPFGERISPQSFKSLLYFKSYDAQIAADRPSSGLKYYNYGRRIFSAYPQTELLNSIVTEFEEFLPTSNSRNRVPLNPSRQSGNSDPFDRKQCLHLLGTLDYRLQSQPGY